MGYESTFSGSFTPSKPIPQAVADIINESDAALVVAGPGDVEYESGDVCPALSAMTAYDFGEDIVRVQHLLSQHGIKLTGSVERRGEDGEDFELFEARNGRIRTRTGRIVYDKGTQLNEGYLTRYSILAVARPHGNKFKYAKPVPVGWLRDTGAISPGSLLRINGDETAYRPPRGALALRDRRRADKIVWRLRKQDKTHLYTVVSWEATLCPE